MPMPTLPPVKSAEYVALENVCVAVQVLATERDAPPLLTTQLRFPFASEERSCPALGADAGNVYVMFADGCAEDRSCVYVLPADVPFNRNVPESSEIDVAGFNDPITQVISAFAMISGYSADTDAELEDGWKKAIPRCDPSELSSHNFVCDAYAVVMLALLGLVKVDQLEITVMISSFKSPE